MKKVIKVKSALSSALPVASAAGSEFDVHLRKEAK